MLEGKTASNSGSSGTVTKINSFKQSSVNVVPTYLTYSTLLLQYEFHTVLEYVGYPHRSGGSYTS